MEPGCVVHCGCPIALDELDHVSHGDVLLQAVGALHQAVVLLDAAGSTARASATTSNTARRPRMGAGRLLWRHLQHLHKPPEILTLPTDDEDLRASRRAQPPSCPAERARLTWDESLSNVPAAVAVLHAAGLLGTLVTLGFVMPGRSAMSTFRHHPRSVRTTRMASS